MLNKIAALIRYIFLSRFSAGIYIPLVSYIGAGSVVKKNGNGFIRAKGKIRLDRNCELESKQKLVIGHNFVMNSYSRIIAHDHIEIGDNVVIARFVTILDHDHAFEKQAATNNLVFNGYATAPIKIGNNVWLGDKVSILKGVTIGDNVIIGANAVVTKDIPDNSIAGGIPAKVIKKL